MMDDGQLWDDERRGAPVSHCRDKIAADERAMRERDNILTRNTIARNAGRRPLLSARWGA